MKDVFFPKERQKVTEQYLRQVLVTSICGILLCMSCLAGTTWAWFTVSLENTGNVIQIASVETVVTVSRGGTAVAPSEDGSYVLNAGQYAVTVSSATDSTATTSKLYAILSIDGAPVGYMPMTEDTSISTFADAEPLRVYRAEVTIQAGKDCKFSWEVSWVEPDGAAMLDGDLIELYVEAESEPAEDNQNPEDETPAPTEAVTGTTTETTTPAETTTQPTEAVTEPDEGAEQPGGMEGESEEAYTEPMESETNETEDNP